MAADTPTLPKTTEELEEIIKNAITPYESQIEYLQQRINTLEKVIFAPKSEKRRPDEGEGGTQLHIFNEAEAIEEKKEEAPLTIAEHSRKRPKRKHLPPDLPRIDVIHDIDESEKVCACGAKLSRIGEEVCEKLDIIPAKVEVIRHIRPKYACRSCEGVESDGPTVLIAPPPPQIIPKGIATPGLLAHVAVSKYADALPLYRQEKMFERCGVDLSRSTMAGWMVMAAKSCTPVMDLLYKELHAGPLINVDETPVQVLNEPGRANTTKSYMWVFRGGDPEKPVLIYRYSPTRSGEVAREVLQGYRGYCQTDAFSGYDGLEQAIEGIRLVGCFAHARRNFVKVIDARGKGAKKKTGSAEVALGISDNYTGLKKRPGQQSFHHPRFNGSESIRQNPFSKSSRPGWKSVKTRLRPKVFWERRLTTPYRAGPDSLVTWKTGTSLRTIMQQRMQLDPSWWDGRTGCSRAARTEPMPPPRFTV